MQNILGGGKMINANFLVKYPFLHVARDFMIRKGLSLEAIFNKPETTILEQAYYRIVDDTLITKHNLPVIISEREAAINIASFYTATVLLSEAKNEALIKTFIEAETERAKAFIIIERPPMIMKIAELLNPYLIRKREHRERIGKITFIDSIIDLDELTAELTTEIKQRILSLINTDYQINTSKASNYIKQLTTIIPPPTVR
jgi:hypothetical protein